jgi:hypothetical protein
MRSVQGAKIAITFQATIPFLRRLKKTEQAHGINSWHQLLNDISLSKFFESACSEWTYKRKAQQAREEKKKPLPLTSSSGGLSCSSSCPGCVSLLLSILRCGKETLQLRPIDVLLITILVHKLSQAISVFELCPEIFRWSSLWEQYNQPETTKTKQGSNQRPNQWSKSK